jgi:Iron-containing redox enzyme
VGTPDSLATSLTEVLHCDARGKGALRAAQARDWRDALSALLAIHALHTAPLWELNGAERFQHDPDIVALKRDLEARLLDRLATGEGELPRLPGDAVAALRILAARDLVPDVYEWLGEAATLPELVEFIAIEGGPDGGFDDLVAICQVGLAGVPKVALATNYWDEMGRGNPAAVHTELHHRLVSALELPRLRAEELPIEALERSALNGLLSTNRALQPEMIGALGLLELQAGPRCRRVVQALRRLGAPADAFPFYEEHAVADPRHGKGWLDRGVGTIVAAHPEWAPRIVRGARWRSDVNRRLFAAVHVRVRGTASSDRAA